MYAPQDTTAQLTKTKKHESAIVDPHPTRTRSAPKRRTRRKKKRGREHAKHASDASAQGPEDDHRGGGGGGGALGRVDDDGMWKGHGKE